MTLLATSNTFTVTGTLSLTASPVTVGAGGTVSVQWAGITSPTPSDWIGLYQSGAADRAFLAWMYVNCSSTAGLAAAAGSCAFTTPASLASGAYELRLFANNSFVRLATSNTFTVTVAALSLTASPVTVGSGETVSVQWARIASPTPRDWIGLFAPGAADTAFVAWTYVSCSKTPGTAVASGTCGFTIPSNRSPGTYELRLFANDSLVRLVTSNTLTVTTSLSVSPATVAAGGAVTVQWAGIASPTPTDWIGLYQSGAADRAYLAWMYVSCSSTAGLAAAAGSCAFTTPAALAPGTYELRLFANDGFTRLRISNGFTVTP
jgi:hypothetical protein